MDNNITLGEDALIRCSVLLSPSNCIDDNCMGEMYFRLSSLCYCYPSLQIEDAVILGIDSGEYITNLDFDGLIVDFKKSLENYFPYLYCDLFGICQYDKENIELIKLVLQDNSEKEISSFLFARPMVNAFYERQPGSQTVSAQFKNGKEKEINCSFKDITEKFFNINKEDNGTKANSLSFTS